MTMNVFWDDIMRRLRNSLTVAVLLLLAHVGRAQTSVAPIYTLPPDGTWVEYQWVLSQGSAGKSEGVLRIHATGKEQKGKKQYRWIELKRSQNKDNDDRSMIRRILIAEDALQNMTLSPTDVAMGIAINNLESSPVRLSPAEIQRLIHLGFSSSDSKLTTVEDNVTVKSTLGRFSTRHVTAHEGNETGSRSYHGWLTPKAPFGWVKFEIREKKGTSPTQTVFRAVATKTGVTRGDKRSK